MLGDEAELEVRDALDRLIMVVVWRGILLPLALDPDEEEAWGN